MTTIIILSVYFFSLVVCFYANKALYKSNPEDYNVLPILWIIPIANTLAPFIFFYLLFKEKDFGVFSSKFWENKWS